MFENTALAYTPTPAFELQSAVSQQAEIKMVIKREDLNHAHVSGNKWWKLKYNLQEAVKLGSKTILTFGGAYSNHIFATAAAANELNLKSIGIIRGEETLPLNSTLSFAQKKGMRLEYVSREEYRRKAEPEFAEILKKKFDDFYLIPEGGTNELAVKGCSEFGEKLLAEIEFDYICLPVGTGGTMAGIINGLKGKKKVLGFSSLKGEEFLEEEIIKYTRHTNWQLIHDYHFGGYAKSTKALTNFSEDFERNFSIPLDPVYTSKMTFGVFDMIKKDFFKRGSAVLIIHTGGLRRSQS